MKITVVLCTYNRCQRLRWTLESLAASTIPGTVEWEVLVVDNNSADQTRKVVEDLSRQHPNRFRYVREPIQGKSYALNSGIREARGDVLAFTDDDVTVAPDWLYRLTRNLESGEWAGAGGRILMTEKFSPPSWLALDGPYSMAGLIGGHLDLGSEPCQLHQAPYGGNMAFRKEMFEKYGNFRLDLGPSPNTHVLRPNEDTEFGRRLMKAGERLRYEPSAIVYHPAQKERARKQYLLATWFDFGRALVREWGRGPDILGIPRPYFNIFKIFMTRVPRAAACWIFALQPQRRFYFKAELWRVAGEITEFYRHGLKRSGSSN